MRELHDAGREDIWRVVYHGLVGNERRRHFALPVLAFLLPFLIDAGVISSGLYSLSFKTASLRLDTPRPCFTVALSPCSTRTRCRWTDSASALPHLYTKQRQQFTTRISPSLEGRPLHIAAQTAFTYTAACALRNNSHRNTSRLRIPLPSLPIVHHCRSAVQHSALKQPIYSTTKANAVRPTVATPAPPCTYFSPLSCSCTLQPQPTSPSPPSHRASTTSRLHVALCTRLPSTGAQHPTSPWAQRAACSVWRAWCGSASA